MVRLACQTTWTHHSRDLIRVFNGGKPRILCGYHAMREGLLQQWSA